MTERNILIVEANCAQAQLIQQTLEARALANPASLLRLTLAADSATAIAHLDRVKTEPTVSRPDLILLDLHLPDQGGSQLLADLKASPVLRRIPVIILTWSDDERDVFKSYELQGNCYVIKSGDTQQLIQTIERIEAFWLGIVTLPSS